MEVAGDDVARAEELAVILGDLARNRDLEESALAAQKQRVAISALRGTVCNKVGDVRRFCARHEADVRLRRRSARSGRSAGVRGWQ